MTCRLEAIFLFLVIFSCQELMAQDTIRSDVYYSGQLNPVAKKDAMQIVYVVGKEEIEHLNAQNLNDVLKYLINALPVYLGAEGANLDYMGNGKKSIQFLMNGLPIWQSTLVQVDLSKWPIYDVERIEVLYGTSSVLYGTNANVAVVNIITKWRKDQISQTLANLNFSGKNEYNFRFKNYLNLGRHGVSVGFGRYYFDGFQGTDSNRVSQWKPTLTHSTNVTYNYALLHNLKAFADYTWVNTTVLDRGYPIPNSTRVYDSEQRSNQLLFHTGVRGKVSKYHTIDFSHVYSRYHTQNLKTIKILTDLSSQPNPNIQPFDKLTYDSYFSQFKISRNNPKSKVDYETGLEFNHQRDLEQSFLEAVKTNITQLAFLTNLTYRPSDIMWLKGGIRYTNSNKFTTPILYSGQFRYKMSEQAYFTAQYARGFRTPTFNELFYTYENPALNILGNLSLQSETYNQFNTTLKIESSDVMVLTNMFWQNTNNGIQLVAVDPTDQVYQFVNTKSAKFIGQSITVQTDQRYYNMRLVFANNGVNQFPEEIGSYYFFQELSGQFQLKIPKEHISLMYLLKYNGARFETRKNALDELEDFSQDGFWLTDISLVASMGKYFKLSFGVKNLGNVLNVNGKFLPIDRLSDQQINSKVPLSIDFGRRGWLSISTKF